LWKSRIDTLNPFYYGRLDPVARKLALQSAGTFAATATTILTLASLAGADVESDPRSADFGKIKVGDTRYDILGGHQQNIRLAAQLLTGQKVNSVTGEIQTLGPERGFGKPSRLDLAYQFLENKENPIIAFGTKALRGTDQVGNPINLANEAAKMVIPLGIQSTYETVKNTGSIPKGVAMNIPGTFGVGVQTYGQEKAPPKNPNNVGGSKNYSLEQTDDGKYSVTIGDKTVTRDNLKDAQALIAKDTFKNSDAKSKTIGDTHYYKTKSGDIKSQPKVMYESQRDTAKNKLDMDRAYESKNTAEWLKIAEKEVENLTKKQGQYDPETEQEEIDKIQLQIENLLDKAGGYIAKGIGGKGGSRGRSGGGGSRGGSSVANPYKYAVSTKASQTPSVKTKLSVKALKGNKKFAVSKAKVSFKKSLV
jgi:hypothetical protein